MQTIAFALPLLPGRTGGYRNALASCWTGERKAAYEDARRRAGIIREAAWIQPGSGGDLAVVHLAADDLRAAFALLRTSAEPFDLWFRHHVRTAHGVALEGGPPSPELVLDFDTTRT